MRREPAYLATYRSGRLAEKVERALELLRSCRVCPRNCDVDRLADEYAVCLTGRYALVSSVFPHFGEEDCLRGWNGSGTIFFGHCNLKCVFCFPPGTRVATPEGLRPIERFFEEGTEERAQGSGQVRWANARVVGRDARPVPAVKAFSHPFEGELVRLLPWNCPPLELTPEHPVFAAHRREADRVRQVPARDLTADHFLVVPKRLPDELPAPSADRAAWREAGPHYLVPLRPSERRRYAGPVYNLEVDDPDHSYLAPFVAVANCQNFDISQRAPRKYTGTRPDELAAMMLHLQEQGCHNINFVTPEHVVPQIVEALPIAIERGLRLPLVYNTSTYDSAASLELLDGLVDIYMPDFKFWDEGVARKYVKAEGYPEAARAGIREMQRQVGDLVFDEHGLAVRGVLVRHLVMPGGLAGTREIVRWLVREVSPDVYVNVMGQYHPAGRVSDKLYAEIDRPVTSEEVEEAVAIAREEGVQRLDSRRPHPKLLFKMMLGR